MTTLRELAWLQDWYRSQCDGQWEHAYGIKIDTLDNPGWSVAIDLKDTSLESAPMEAIRRDNSVDDWMQVEVSGARFLGRGDPHKLDMILALFREWASSTDSARRYD